MSSDHLEAYEEYSSEREEAEASYDNYLEVTTPDGKYMLIPLDWLQEVLGMTEGRTFLPPSYEEH